MAPWFAIQHTQSLKTNLKLLQDIPLKVFKKSSRTIATLGGSHSGRKYKTQMTMDTHMYITTAVQLAQLGAIAPAKRERAKPLQNWNLVCTKSPTQVPLL